MAKEVLYQFLGMNNVDDPAQVGAPRDTRALIYTEAVLLSNVDPNSNGGVSLRSGWEEAIAAAGLHSGWSNPLDPKEAYFANGTLLNRINADGSITAVKFDLIPGIPVTFCQINDVVAYSNGIQFGVLEGGKDTPPFIPTLPYKERMVAGKFMDFYNGRLYALVDNYDGTPGCALICSDSFDTPGAIESMDTRQNVVAVYDGPGKMLHHVGEGSSGGLYVSAGSETFFHPGKDAVLDGGFDGQKSVATYPAIPGTARMIKAELLGGDSTGTVGIWASTRGVCIGTASGSFKNLTRKKVTYPEGSTGTAVVLERNGQAHYLFVLQGG